MPNTVKIPSSTVAAVVGTDVANQLETWAKFKDKGWDVLDGARATPEDLAKALAGEKPLLLLGYPKNMEQLETLEQQPNRKLIGVFYAGIVPPTADRMYMEQLRKFNRLKRLDVSKMKQAPVDIMGHLKSMLRADIMPKKVRKG